MSGHYNGEEPYLYSEHEATSGGNTPPTDDSSPEEKRYAAQCQRRIEPQGGGWQRAAYPKITGVKIER